MKIIQPESNELQLTVRPMIEKGGGQVRLSISADPSLPLCYLRSDSQQAPATAPAFCMLLRKHLQNGKILKIEQPSLERVIRITVEHMNEMGDPGIHVLVAELMGKHSNIILLDDKEIVTDSIRHVSQMVSSVREVLPGRPYFIPETRNKRDPLSETRESFLSLLSQAAASPAEHLVRTYTGFSNVVSAQIVYESALSQEQSCSALGDEDKERLYASFNAALDRVRSGNFEPVIYYRGGEQGRTPEEYAAFPLSMYRGLKEERFSGMSLLIESYYREKNISTRIRQRSQDLRRIVQTHLERDLHKYDLWQKQLKDTDKKDRYRLYGELLMTYASQIPEGAESADLLNYYTNETVRVPLDPTMTPIENARRFYDRYGKMKRTKEALTGLIKETGEEIEQLENIRSALDMAVTGADLSQIRQELEGSGFVRRHPGKDRNKARKEPESRPLHFISSDGFDIFVGKNNLQNDELTFHTAQGSDIWFHANDMPGSHVILKTGGVPFEKIPDRAFEEAASLAAYYSRGREAGRVEVDYLERRGVKKPGGARPGFVIYHTNYSILAGTDISGIRKAEEK